MHKLSLELPITLLMVALFNGTILAQQTNIANDELESVGPIEFSNYVGPHERLDSLADIIAIGTQLADLDEVGRSDYGGKYSLQHIVSGGKLFDADILSLSPSAGVDHVRNLRHIISGYLQVLYGYEGEAADTISTFVTYYNAYYQKNAEYFQQRFSLAVNEALLPENIGLSTNYADWPGATQIIIPLSANPVLEQGPAPNLDETGKKMVSEYLRDTEEDKQAAKDTLQDMLVLRQEQLQDEQNILREKQVVFQQENQKVEKALQIATAIEAATDNLQQRQAAQEERRQLKEQLQGNQKSQNQLSAVQQTIAQRQESLNKDQRELNRLSPTEVPLPKASVVVLLPVKNHFFQFYAIDSESLELHGRSRVNSIRSMEFVANNAGYIVVAGGSTETPIEPENRIRLLKLQKNLSDEAQGSDDLHPDSGVWEHKGQIFAFLANGNLGRFNMDLQLQARSIEVLLPSLRPQFIGSYALAQNQQEEFVWLDVLALKREKQLVAVQ